MIFILFVNITDNFSDLLIQEFSRDTLLCNSYAMKAIYVIFNEYNSNYLSRKFSKNKVKIKCPSTSK